MDEKRGRGNRRKKKETSHPLNHKTKNDQNVTNKSSTMFGVMGSRFVVLDLTSTER